MREIPTSIHKMGGPSVKLHLTLGFSSYLIKLVMFTSAIMV